MLTLSMVGWDARSASPVLVLSMVATMQDTSDVEIKAPAVEIQVQEDFSLFSLE